MLTILMKRAIPIVPHDKQHFISPVNNQKSNRSDLSHVRRDNHSIIISLHFTHNPSKLYQ